MAKIASLPRDSDGKMPKPIKRRMDSWIVAGFVAVILFSAVLRVVRLHTIPPGLFFDEAANLFDIQAILHGWHPIYFPRNNGREPFFFYWASLFASIWGTNAYAIRLASAMIGVLTVAATFFCAREFFRLWKIQERRADWLALGAAFTLSVTYLDLHYSRIGLRTITLPLFLAISYGFLFRAIRRDQDDWKTWLSFAAAGVWGGLSTYTYIPSRIAPSLLVIPFVLLLFQRRSWKPFIQIVLVGLLWVGVSTPLGLYYLHHPNQVQGHTNSVSILNPTSDHGDPVGAVVHGLVATFGAFDFVGTPAAEQNLPGRPIFDPVASVFFALGWIFLLVGTLRPEIMKNSGDPAKPTRWLHVMGGIFIVAWVFTQALPSALAVNPPGFIRMTGTLPAIAIVAAAGYGFAEKLLQKIGLARGIRWGLVGVALGVSAVWTIHDYFFVWGPSPAAYHLMMGDKTDSAAFLNQWAKSERVFLAPLYAQDNTIKFLTQSAEIQSFDIGLSLVVPTDRTRDVRYVFPATDRTEANQVREELPVRPIVATVYDPSRRFPLLTTLTIPKSELPPAPAKRIATLDGKIALVDAQVTPTSQTAGQNIRVELRWLALKRLPTNYTVFIHLLDAKNQTVAQVDRQPTGGSFPTLAWHVGDLVVDRYDLAVPKGVPVGHYQLVAGMYELKTLKRLPTYLSTGRAPADEIPIGQVDIVATGP